MNLEEWFFTVDYAASVWMDGMMTIQPLIINIGALIAYKEFNLKQNEPKESH